MWYRRNPFADLDDTPDDPRLGKKLILSAVGLAVVRWSWSHFARQSFDRVSLAYVRYEPYFHRGNHFTASDFAFDTWFVVFMLGFIGTFIFFRRGVWWWQDREDEKSITRLNLK